MATQEYDCSVCGSFVPCACYCELSFEEMDYWQLNDVQQEIDDERDRLTRQQPRVGPWTQEATEEMDSLDAAAQLCLNCLLSLAEEKEEEYVPCSCCGTELDENTARMMDGMCADCYWEDDARRKKEYRAWLKEDPQRFKAWQESCAQVLFG